MLTDLEVTLVSCRLAKCTKHAFQTYPIASSDVAIESLELFHSVNVSLLRGHMQGSVTILHKNSTITYVRTYGLRMRLPCSAIIVQSQSRLCNNSNMKVGTTVQDYTSWHLSIIICCVIAPHFAISLSDTVLVG